MHAVHFVLDALQYVPLHCLSQSILPVYTGSWQSVGGAAKQDSALFDCRQAALHVVDEQEASIRHAMAMRR